MAMKEDRKGNIVIFGKNSKRKLFLMGFSMIAIFIAVLMSSQFFIKSSKKAKEEKTSPEKTAKLIAITIGASVIGGLIGGFYLSRKAEDVTITISDEDVEIEIGETKRSFKIESFCGVTRNYDSSKSVMTGVDSRLYFAPDPEDPTMYDYVKFPSMTDSLVRQAADVLSKRRTEILGGIHYVPFEGDTFTSKENKEAKQQVLQRNMIMGMIIIFPILIISFGIMFLITGMAPASTSTVILILGVITLLMSIGLSYYLKKVNKATSAKQLWELTFSDKEITINRENISYSDIRSISMTAPYYWEYLAEGRMIEFYFKDGNKFQRYFIMKRRSFGKSEADEAKDCSCPYPALFGKVKEVCESKGVPFSEIDEISQHMSQSKD